MLSLMLRMCKPIVGTGKDVILGSGFCVAKLIIELESKGLYEEYLIQKRCYWLKLVTGTLLMLNFNIRKLVMLICLKQEPSKLSHSKYFYEIYRLCDEEYG